MKNLTKLLSGTFALAIAATAITTSAFAYRGDYSEQGPDYSAERHEAMEEAFVNSNYREWLELMNGRGRVTQIINEENFAKFAEAHRLAHEGNLEGADAIRKELGLRTRDGEKVGAGYGKRRDNRDGSEKGQMLGRMNVEHRGQNQGGDNL